MGLDDPRYTKGLERYTEDLEAVLKVAIGRIMDLCSDRDAQTVLKRLGFYPTSAGYKASMRALKK